MYSIQPNSFDGHPAGIMLYGGVHGSQYVFRHVVIRGNVIRYAKSGTDPFPWALGIEIDSCENAIVEQNVIDLDNGFPVRQYPCLNVKYFENRTSSGKLLPGTLVDNSSQVLGTKNEVATDIEGAMLLSL